MPFEAALVQARPALGDVKANAARILDTLRRERADLVVFPELFLSGYAVRDGFGALALDLDGPLVREIADACRASGKTLVTGAPTRARQRGVVHNSLLLFTPDGRVQAYDKVYLPTFSLFEEDHFFAEGSALPVFDVTLAGERVKLGLCICYDLFFPEVTKALAMKGADVIVCAAASPTPSRASFEAVFPARAVETTCHLLFTNLAGPQDAALFWGGAQAWSPRGEKTAQAPYDEEHVLHARCDLVDVEEARRRRPALRDTRAEVLRMLLDSAQG
ncbi:MAG TPA: carbon-nitrogen hydrolase family protein [Candidatus Thermoplasmatota archaeon]|nr:carbon-nitrogen hydrolase family protein [Candidatus Thermoplasmatota archaeon]